MHASDGEIRERRATNARINAKRNNRPALNAFRAPNGAHPRERPRGTSWRSAIRIESIVPRELDGTSMSALDDGRVLRFVVPVSSLSERQRTLEVRTHSFVARQSKSRREKRVLPVAM